MKKLLLSFFFGLCTLMSVRASTILFTTELFGSGSPVFQDLSGALLSDGCLVRIGSFANEEALSLGMSIAEMETAGGWLDFGTMEISSPFDYSGKLYGGVTNNSGTGSLLEGLKVYVWVFNAASSDTAEATGIFRATNGEFPWLFPVDALGGGDIITLSMDELSMSAIGGIGSVSGGALQLAALPIPEPSSMFLGGVALGILVARRFRRKQA